MNAVFCTRDFENLPSFSFGDPCRLICFACYSRQSFGLNAGITHGKFMPIRHLDDFGRFGDRLGLLVSRRGDRGSEALHLRLAFRAQVEDGFGGLRGFACKRG